MEDLEKRTLEL